MIISGTGNDHSEDSTEVTVCSGDGNPHYTELFD